MNSFILRRFFIPCGLALTGAGLCAQQQPAPSPADLVPGNTVVVKVDGKDITADEIRQAMLNMPPEFTTLYDRNPTYAVQQMFIMRHLAEEAEKAKLADQNPLKDQLALLRANVLASAMVSYQHNTYMPSVEATKEFYEHNKDKYRMAKIKGIALSSGAVGPTPSLEEMAKAAAEGRSVLAQRPQRSTEETRKLAADLVQQLRQGADFGKLVAQYSEDPQSKAANGDFPAVDSASSYPENVKQAVLALKPGDVSEPIVIENKVYIFRLEQITYQPFEQVNANVTEELRRRHMDEWMQEMTKRFVPVVENQQFFSNGKTGVVVAPGSPVITAPGAAQQPPAK